MTQMLSYGTPRNLYTYDHLPIEAGPIHPKVAMLSCGHAGAVHPAAVSIKPKALALNASSTLRNDITRDLTELHRLVGTKRTVLGPIPCAEHSPHRPYRPVIARPNTPISAVTEADFIKLSPPVPSGPEIVAMFAKNDHDIGSNKIMFKPMQWDEPSMENWADEVPEGLINFMAAKQSRAASSKLTEWEPRSPRPKPVITIDNVIASFALSEPVDSTPNKVLPPSEGACIRRSPPCMDLLGLATSFFESKDGKIPSPPLSKISSSSGSGHSSPERVVPETQPPLSDAIYIRSRSPPSRRSSPPDPDLRLPSPRLADLVPPDIPTCPPDSSISPSPGHISLPESSAQTPDLPTITEEDEGTHRYHPINDDGDDDDADDDRDDEDHSKKLISAHELDQLRTNLNSLAAGYLYYEREASLAHSERSWVAACLTYTRQLDDLLFFTIHPSYVLNILVDFCGLDYGVNQTTSTAFLRLLNGLAASVHSPLPGGAAVFDDMRATYQLWARVFHCILRPYDAVDPVVRVTPRDPCDFLLPASVVERYSPSDALWLFVNTADLALLRQVQPVLRLLHSACKETMRGVVLSLLLERVNDDALDARRDRGSVLQIKRQVLIARSAGWHLGTEDQGGLARITSDDLGRVWPMVQ